MLECRDLTVSFGEKAVLSGCSLSLAPGQRIALMGPSGCGKTTLLRVLLSLRKPDHGTVHVSARRIGAVFQEPRLFPWLTAAENVRAVLPSGSLSDARDWLARLELADAAGLYPSELSGGMQQRVSLARALAVKPDLLILDEPFKGLDSGLYDRVLQTVLSVLEPPSGASLILTTHSAAEADALGCRILTYRDGRFAPQ